MIGASRRFKMTALLAGDAAAAYAALAAALYFRYGSSGFAEQWAFHTRPFAWVFAAWAAVFFIVGLYEFDNLRSRIDLLARGGEALVACVALAFGVFYLAPGLGIAPKTNLLIVTGIFALLFIAWRLYTLHLFSLERFRSKVLFVGAAPEADELCAALNANPHLGYGCLGVIADANDRAWPACDVIVVSHLLEAGSETTRGLYRRLSTATAIVDLPSFYERIRRSVPASALDERWVLRHLGAQADPIGDHLKRVFDLVLALVLSIPALALLPLGALCVWVTDRGPIFYRQSRVGKGGRTFMMLKLRTMRVDAEKGGAAFAQQNDARVTPIGRLLRATRLDELPQLWNILKGEMSFVGPRPERPEMEEELSKKIPLFPVRHLCTPGLTGWAQVSQPYAATDEDHLRKLRFDLYYLKHRSMALDFAILLKTVYSVVKRKGR